MLLVRHQNIQQDIRVDGRNHRPRTSSMYLSTDEYPSSVKFFLQRPFHFRKTGSLGAFFKTIERPTTWNSTSVSGASWNRSRISLGMVTWPRSPTFILHSMT